MGEVKSTGSGDSIRRPDRERCFLQLECILKVRQEQRISGVQIDTHHKSYFQIEKVIVHGYKTFSTFKYSEDLICLVRGCFLFRKQPLTKQIRSSEYMVWVCVCVKKFNVKKLSLGLGEASDWFTDRSSNLGESIWIILNCGAKYSELKCL